MEKKPIKIKDIAERANVSTGTVDRVLHNRGDVSEKTKAKVLKIIEELGYTTNIIAKTLASKKQTVFATLLPSGDQQSSYWDRPLIGFEKAQKELSTYGVSLKNYFFDINNRDSFSKQCKLILKDKPQALVIAPVFQQEALTFIHQLEEANIPFIFLDSNLEFQNKSLGYIGHDSQQSGKVAAKLIDTRTQNEDTIVLINLAPNPKNQNHLKQRANGFKEYFYNKNRIGAIIEIDITNLENNFIEEKLKHTYNQISNITAIFVTSSKVHVIAKYLKKNNLSDKIILIGYDLIPKNISYLENDTIDYLISQNPIEQGYSSVMQLFQAVILRQPIRKINYLPIDIIIKENLMYS